MPDSSSSAALKIGTVDMKRVFDTSQRSKEAEKVLSESRQFAKNDLESQNADYRRLVEELQRLGAEMNQPQSSALREAKERQHQIKVRELQEKERGLRELQQVHQNRVQEQATRLRNEIVEQMRQVIARLVERDGYDLVFDSAGVSLHGVPVLLHARAAYDFTDAVIAELNSLPSGEKA